MPRREASGTSTARARVRMCSLGGKAQRSRRRDPSARSRETLFDARTPLGALVGLVRAICMLLCALQQSYSTMKAAVLLATAAHAAKQAVEEPAESPVACVPASLPN